MKNIITLMILSLFSSSCCIGFTKGKGESKIENVLSGKENIQFYYYDGSGFTDATPGVNLFTIQNSKVSFNQQILRKDELSIFNNNLPDNNKIKENDVFYGIDDKTFYLVPNNNHMDVLFLFNDDNTLNYFVIKTKERINNVFIEDDIYVLLNDTMEIYSKEGVLLKEKKLKNIEALNDKVPFYQNNNLYFVENNSLCKYEIETGNITDMKIRIRKIFYTTKDEIIGYRDRKIIIIKNADNIESIGLYGNLSPFNLIVYDDIIVAVCGDINFNQLAYSESYYFVVINRKTENYHLYEIKYGTEIINNKLGIYYWKH